MLELALDDARWAELVSSSPGAGPFHHPAWAQLLARCYRLRPLALLTEDGDAGIPVLEARRGRRIALPFTDACAPLAQSEDALRRLTRELAASGPIEVRAPLEGDGFVAHVRGVTHLLELDEPERVRARFRPQMRRNIARSEREGVVVRAGETRADLTGTFYELHLRTRRRQGVPVQPRRFFHLLWDDVVARGLGTVQLAYSGATPVAGAVFLHWNGTSVYKFGASEPAHWHLRPNNLVFWAAIRDACARGDRTFDFGRTELDNAGLRAFKSGWGARELPLRYTYAGAAPAADARGLVLRALATAIRRSPTWVCRAVGEAGYRFAA